MFKIISNHSNPELVIVSHLPRIYVTVTVEDTSDGKQYIAKVPFLYSFKYKVGKSLYECKASFPLIDGEN